ncbi:MAG: hypothetical protein DVB26_07685 [Verrucomicrobia bacterium]|nr:MAG: hypothetical protein DVB26_07685 [Verrucomicrobiota bacterium]
MHGSGVVRPAKIGNFARRARRKINNSPAAQNPRSLCSRKRPFSPAVAPQSDELSKIKKSQKLVDAVGWLV